MPTKAELEEQIRQLQTELENRPYETGAEDFREADAADIGVADPPDLKKVDIDAFLEEAGTPGADLVVDGYRYDDEADGKLKYVYRWIRDDFTLHKVKEQFGGGRWHFRLKTAKGDNIKAKNVQIEGPPKKGVKEVDPQDDPRGFAEKILDTQALLVEKLEEVRAGPPAGAVADPINMALSVVGAFQSVLAPYQQALLNKESDGPNFAELVGILQQGIEMGKATAAPPSDPMGNVLAATLPGLMNVIGAGQPATPEPAEVLKTMDRTPAPQPPAQESPPRPGWDILLANWLPMLAGWARKDADTDLMAAFVTHELPPDAEAMILAELKKGPAFLTEFLTLHPDLKPWEPWFDRFWRAIADCYEWGSEEMGPHPYHGSQLALLEDVPDETADPPEQERVEVEQP